jgi:hypothetical protein
LVVGSSLLFGTLRAFSGARAAQAPTATPEPSALAIASQPLVETVTPQPLALTASPTSRAAAALTDTTGVIALSIIVVAVIVAGILWGEHRPARRAAK